MKRPPNSRILENHSCVQPRSSTNQLFREPDLLQPLLILPIIHSHYPSSSRRLRPKRKCHGLSQEVLRLGGGVGGHLSCLPTEFRIPPSSLNILIPLSTLKNLVSKTNSYKRPARRIELTPRLTMERLQASFKKLSNIGRTDKKSSIGDRSSRYEIYEKPSRFDAGENSSNDPALIVGSSAVRRKSRVQERPKEDERFVVIGRSDLSGLDNGPYYRYRTLPTHDSFRVMELLPGSKEDQIQIELKTVSWDTPPAYEPISYRWGDRNDVQECICDGKPLTITKSLYSALVHFRSAKTRRILWADAVW
jgi:hypothetical protein